MPLNDYLGPSLLLSDSASFRLWGEISCLPPILLHYVLPHHSSASKQKSQDTINRNVWKRWAKRLPLRCFLAICLEQHEQNRASVSEEWHSHWLFRLWWLWNPSSVTFIINLVFTTGFWFTLGWTEWLGS